MKKFLILILLSVFLLPHALYAAGNCATYTDVQSDTWYCPMLTYLQEQKILSENPKFNPEFKINRAEALKVLTEMNGERNEIYAKQLFEVKSSDWFSPYMNLAYALKYIQPEDGKMNPGAPVSKAEFIILFMKFADIEKGSSTSCSLGTPVISPWLNITSAEVKQYLCKAKTDLEILEFSDASLPRAVAMAVIYKGIQ